MEVYKIDIRSWTASFRYPNLISGTQPTLEVPPISTVLGLINAAAGQYLRHQQLQLGYYFEYEAAGEDLETIYQVSSKDGKPTNNAKSNIIYRRFLYNNYLRIYTTDAQIAGFLSQPYYQLVLGRMNDLATVEKVWRVNKLEKVEHSTAISGQLIPLRYQMPGQIQALPQYFTNEFPRKNLGTSPYSIIHHKSRLSSRDITTYLDVLPDGKEVHIYFHELNFQ
ncbi:type I-B CRISPR-associated protein Cas5b [Paraflavitalea speifideaquila]|uniref:type I-B CRISPR-associated protein Cas5b n=1 Tax=Paraflavitalea speifideaquila TaxID=3076558 RepID=UPI0028E719AF|nr:type I-B CRISPR-associated protein Cas5b [Paraflavitalea speifideiaquila]